MFTYSIFLSILVESPGIAFYGLAPLGTGESLIKIIVDASPLLVIITLMVMVAGIVFWLVVSACSNSTVKFIGIADIGAQGHI